MNLQQKNPINGVSTILVTNYYSTKLFILNILNALKLNRNKSLLKKKKTRLTHFYSSLNFNAKYEN